MDRRIRKCLLDYKKGDYHEYDRLVSIVGDPNIPNAELELYLKSFQKCVSLIDRKFETLIGSLLNRPWALTSCDLGKQYHIFITSLLSAHTYYIKYCLRSILSQYCPVNTSGKLDKSTVESSFSLLHLVLEDIFKIAPMCLTMLQSLANECFPYIGVSRNVLECYTNNLLYFTSYAPLEIRPHILYIIIDKLAQIDVRAPRADIDEAIGKKKSRTSTEHDSSIFHMDELGCYLNKDEEKNEKEMKHQDADKLDGLLSIVFNYIHDCCYNEDQLDWTSTKQLYRELLTIFDRIILPTHSCCHVQFIYFYICSFKQELSEGFVDYLWKKVQDPNVETIYRQFAVSYISSLLARANYIKIGMVQSCLDLLVSWIRRYVAQISDTLSNGFSIVKCQNGSATSDLVQHGAFYSVCQAVFYLIAFCHHELFKSEEGRSFCRSLSLQTIVTSSLNPLRFCLPLVAQSFSSIARKYQLAFCDTIMERNKRLFLPTASDQKDYEAVRSQQSNPLSIFFPFDPYLLPNSKKYINNIYRDYEGLDETDQENSSSYPMSEEAYYDMEYLLEEDHGKITKDQIYDEAECVRMLVEKNSSSIITVSPRDFMMYGTSPGFKNQ